MNTIAHASAFIALLWLALFAIQTLAEDQLSYAVFGLALLYVPLTIKAIDDDLMIITGRGPLSRRQR
jgi:putative effector of murein hydrolase LrgA (UPF0299 family)|tara:strand:- start:3615 stop:3815 length:201 start_codon:yes stop_codon:yes gene_type:complete